MRVGTFLDVDGVLSVKAINLQYAQLLGVEDKLIDLERRYANREIDNDEFNRVFVPLFRNAGFSQTFAQENFDRIQMRTNSDNLLAASPYTFLVTSGPSYFVEVLAQKHGISPERLLCSKYTFDSSGLLSRCVRPVTSTMKGSFVQERVAQFDITVGVGDTEQDIEFLGHCGVRIQMAGNRLEYFNVRELQPVLDVIRKFLTTRILVDRRHEAALARLYEHSPFEKNVFIMTPFRSEARYRETVRCIREALDEVGLKGWLATDLNLDPQLWDNVQAFLIGCRAGVAIFSHDDTRSGRSAAPSAVFNPNVSIEVGYMMSRRRPVLLLKEKRLARLPTDMVGFLYHDFDSETAPESIRNAIRRWANVEGLGPGRAA